MLILVKPTVPEKAEAPISVTPSADKVVKLIAPVKETGSIFLTVSGKTIEVISTLSLKASVSTLVALIKSSALKEPSQVEPISAAVYFSYLINLSTNSLVIIPSAGTGGLGSFIIFNLSGVVPQRVALAIFIFSDSTNLIPR
jgi:hypothetical protein